MSLSFKYSTSHRSLHSFPTRRSSDLLPGCEKKSRQAGFPSGARNLLLLNSRKKQVPRDRKSTRLNSSHRCISYAVFCLKKKNKCAALSVVTLFDTFHDALGVVCVDGM